MDRPPTSRTSSRARRAASALFAAVVLAASPAGASAQWLVVRAGVGEPSGDERALAAALRGALEDAGRAVLPDPTAAAQASTLLSRERTVVEADRIAELVDAVRVLEEHVAMRRREAALEAAERVRELSSGVAEALEEQREVAQRLFDACVAEAWLHIQLGEGESARTDLRRCREAYPDIAADPHAMSSRVFDLITEIDRELAARPAFQIRVEGPPAGCEISLDGRRRAVAPAPIEGVFSGEHRLEVECAGLRRTRIHSILLGAADLTVSIDPAFDDALRTAGGVWLDYASASGGAARRTADARVIGRALGASDVVLVTMGASSARLDRVEIESGRVSAATSLALPHDETSLARAAAALVAGEGAGDDAPDATPTGGGPDGGLVAGLALAAVGLASVGAAWGTYAWRYDLGQRVYEVAPGSAEHARRLADRDAATPVPFALGTLGSLAAIVSLPLWLPETEEFPWWSALPAAAGAALVGVGIYQYTGDGRCVALTDGCAQTFSTTLSGTLWLASGLPLLAVPIVYAFRALVGHAPAGAPAVTSASARIDASPHHVVIDVGGRF